MAKDKEVAVVDAITKEVNTELAKVETQQALLATTFKGLAIPQMKQAIMEGMIRGFEFKDFLQKNVYAVPFGDSYSLVTSIDYARKIAMHSGLCGTSKPVYEVVDGKIVSCEITVKRNVEGVIGEYTALVYFEEYYNGNKDADGNVIVISGRNGKYNKKPTLWDTKPRTMIAKVAEMHALRKAFPEKMAKQYVEEEIEREREIIHVESTPVNPAPAKTDTTEAKKRLNEAKDLIELNKIWRSLPEDQRQDAELIELGGSLKKGFLKK